MAEPRLPYHFAKQNGVVLAQQDDTLVLYARTPIAWPILQECQRYIQQPFTLTALSEGEFNQKLAKTYQATTKAHEMLENVEESYDLQSMLNEFSQPEDLLATEDDAPIIRLINALLQEALKHKASDIHIETYSANVIIRYRIDGVLREALSIPRALSNLIVSRIKVMAKLNIAEKRLPQDGRFGVQLAGHNIDVRVATLPAQHGERIVLRILDKQNSVLDLVALGMREDLFQKTCQLIQKPYGIILVTGPTGAGKTSTLYAMLSRLNTVKSNILTIEDPIEYDLPGIGQTQVNRKIDLNFARGLRAILRQDPDIVMVGEIRDLETAQIAVQASLTGHLVLSTLHTNTAIGAVTRLRDMGIPSYLLASSLTGLLAQRLIRLLCSDCRQAYPADATEKRLLNAEEASDLMLYHPQGCANCFHTGYRGRRAIYEVIGIDGELPRLIHDNVTEKTLLQAARTSSDSLLENARQAVLAGASSLEELMRINYE